MALMFVFIVGILSLGGMLVGPKLWDMYGPATPTPLPEYRDIRQIFTPSSEMVGCVEEVIQLGPPESQLYFYSALAVVVDMDLIEGLAEKDNLDDVTVAWIWEPEEGLKYTLRVVGALSLEFTPLCTIPNEDGSAPGWMVFESVEVKILDR